MPSKEEFLAAREKDLQKRAKNDLKMVLSTPGGRRCMLQLLQLCGYRNPPFVPGDPQATSFNCGKLAVAFWLEKAVKDVDADVFLQMEKEYSAEVKQHALEAEKLEEYL